MYLGLNDEDEEGTWVNPYSDEAVIIDSLWEPGQPHPTYGVSAYLKKVKVLELAEHGDAEDDEDF